MNTSQKHLLLALAFSTALAGSAFAGQTLGGAPKDQTDPDATIWSEVQRDHAATFGHAGVMAPRSKASAAARPPGASFAALAGAPKDQTDPDAAVRNEVQREHFRSFGHPDVMTAPPAVAPGRGTRTQNATLTITYGQVWSATDPDPAIRANLQRDVIIR